MLSIGEFSRLSRVSSRMLRYYDSMGLLCPAQTGRENGYRYYDISQLETLLRIETLKGYGFTLSEIRELLPLPQEIIAKRIHYRRLRAYEELNEMRKELRRMEDDLVKMEAADFMQEKYQVIVMQTPPLRVFGIRRRISISETHALFQALNDEMNRRGIQRSGATQLLYHGKEFSYDDMDAEAQAQVTGEHPDIREVPGQLCAATTHIGPYEDLRYAYNAICAWMAEHPEYKVCGPAIERYLKDEDTAKSPEELETGVLFPIERAE
jgi:DNA-binding transcriptional MerR regulator